MLRPKDIREALRREKYAHAHKIVNKFATRFPSAEMSAWASAAHAEIAYAQKFPWWRHEVEGRIGDPPVSASAPRARTKSEKRDVRDATFWREVLRRAEGNLVEAVLSLEIRQVRGFGRVVLADGSERDVPYGVVSTGRSGVRGHGAVEIIYDEVAHLGVRPSALWFDVDGE